MRATTGRDPGIRCHPFGARGIGNRVRDPGARSGRGGPEVREGREGPESGRGGPIGAGDGRRDGERRTSPPDAGELSRSQANLARPSPGALPEACLPALVPESGPCPLSLVRDPDPFACPGQCPVFYLEQIARVVSSVRMGGKEKPGREVSPGRAGCGEVGGFYRRCRE